MIAIIIAAEKRPELFGLDEHLPLCLFPLGDRPILHHVVDFLAGQGVRRFEFVLGHFPEKIESYLGDGARWGCSFGFHLLPETADPFQLVDTIASGSPDDIVVGRGDRLPQIDLKTVKGPTLFVTGFGAWTGWAAVPSDSRLLAGLGAHTSGKSGFHDGAFAETMVRREVSFESAWRLLESQRDLLMGTFSASTIGGREREPGVWISRNVSLHPTVELLAPVYIGANCRIEEGARIGPSAVIGEGCIVDEQSSVANTLVAPGTYIGQGLELQDVIVDRNRLVNAKIGTSFLVSDSFLLSGLRQRRKRRPVQRLLSSAAALALLLLTLPIAVFTLLILLLGRKGELRRTPAVSLPAPEDPREWREFQYPRLRLHAATATGWWTEFVAEVWPGLIWVLKGELFLVGVKPRSRREIQALSSDWRSIYLQSKAGLITEASVMFGKSPSEDEYFTAEAYYNATESVSHDLKLLRLYLHRLLINGDRTTGADSDLGPALENVPER
jgi:NDP-sugar pyrophosphorylase family protein